MAKSQKIDFTTYPIGDISKLEQKDEIRNLRNQVTEEISKLEEQYIEAFALNQKTIANTNTELEKAEEALATMKTTLESTKKQKFADERKNLPILRRAVHRML